MSLIPPKWPHCARPEWKKILLAKNDLHVVKRILYATGLRTVARWLEVVGSKHWKLPNMHLQTNFFSSIFFKPSLREGFKKINKLEYSSRGEGGRK